MVVGHGIAVGREMLTVRVKRIPSNGGDAKEACFDNGDDSGRAKRLMKEKLSQRPYQFVSFLFFFLSRRFHSFWISRVQQR